MILRSRKESLGSWVMVVEASIETRGRKLEARFQHPVSSF